MVAIVERNEDRPLRAAKEKALPHRVLAHCVHRVWWEAANDRRPVLASIVRAVDKGPLVIEANPVHSRVSRVGIEPPCLEQRYLAPGSQTRRRDVPPTLTSIASHVDETVVGSCPDRM